MTKFVTFGIAAAAVVLAVVMGVRFLPGGIPGPAAVPSTAPTAAPATSTTPAPTPSTAPAASPTIAVTSAPSPSTGVVGRAQAQLAAGTWTAGDPFQVQVTFTSDGSWLGNVGGPYGLFLVRAGGGELTFEILDMIFPDPCDYEAGVLQPPPETLEGMVGALRSLPGFDATEAVDVSFGDFAGKAFTITAPDSSSGCTRNTLRVWQLLRGTPNDFRPGESQRLWVVDVGEQLMVIRAPEPPGFTDDDRAAVDALLESVNLATQD